MNVPTQLSSVVDNPPWQRNLQERLDSLGRRYGPTVVTQNYTFTETDQIDSLQVDATAGNVTITLPSPTGNRRRRIVKSDLSTNTVTISAGSFTINQQTTHTLYAAFRFIEVEPTGTDWRVTSFGQALFITGTGNLQLGIRSLATTATSGFPYIPSCAGVPTGVPASYSGCAPLVVDSTNNDLYFYSGGWVLANSGGGGGSLTVGTATVDFGAFPGTNEASIAVTGQGSITTNNRAIATIPADGTTADHTASDHKYAAALIALTCDTPIAGTGFTIFARCLDKMQGTFTLNWAY